MGCYSLLQGIFLTQESNPGLLLWQAGSLPLSHQGNPCNRLIEAEFQSHAVHPIKLLRLLVFNIFTTG